jgi:hypothetical protein
LYGVLIVDDDLLSWLSYRSIPKVRLLKPKELVVGILPLDWHIDIPDPLVTSTVLMHSLVSTITVTAPVAC